jgi:hypothetical protein
MADPICVYLQHIPNSLHHTYDVFRSYKNYLNILHVCWKLLGNKTRTNVISSLGFTIGVVD